MTSCIEQVYMILPVSGKACIITTEATQYNRILQLLANFRNIIEIFSNISFSYYNLCLYLIHHHHSIFIGIIFFLRTSSTCCIDIT